MRRFGASGDGVTIDSDAVNRAIARAAEDGKGGTVYVPAGAYACCSIRLWTNIALYPAPGATLLAAAWGAAR